MRSIFRFIVDKFTEPSSPESVGVRDFSVTMRVQAINVLSWLFLVSGLCFALLNVAHGLWPLVLLNLAAFAVGSTSLLLARSGKISWANSLLGFGALCVCVSSSLLFRNGADVFLIGILLCSALIADPPGLRRSLAIASALGYLVVKAVQFHHPESIPFPLFRYLLNHAFFLAALYFLLSWFRRANLRHQKEMESMRAELETEHRVAVEKAKELELANKSKQKILSVISHDLRGPVGGLKMSMEAFASGDLSRDEFQELLTALEEEIFHVETGLENLLNWSAGQLESLRPEPKFFRVFAIASNAMGILRKSAERKNIHLINSIPADLEAFADPDQTIIIFRNLLSNAVKFTPPGGTVELHGATKRAFVRIEVSDTGTGLPAGFQADTFTSSSKTSTPGTLGETGSGLGLWICSQFVRAQNGEIGAASRPQGGASFWFTLPSEPPEPR